MRQPTTKEQKRVAEIAACPFGIHEALHTAHVLMDSYGSHVLEHPAVTERPELVALGDKAMEALRAVYQALGALPESDASCTPHSP